MTSSVIVSGASGFVGHAVSATMMARGYGVIGLVRRPQTALQGVREWVLAKDNFADIEVHWPQELGHRCDAVIHLAARVHMMDEPMSQYPLPFKGFNKSAAALAAYRETNVAGTLRIARAGHAAGVRRFVFVSSIKALGDCDPGQPLRELDEPAPTDPYGLSKLEAERALRAYAEEVGLDVVIVRPPLVYGPGVRANFLQLMRAIAAGIPLPLGAITACRSLIFVNNLASALVQCAIDPRAAGETFHVTDGKDLSVTDLAGLLATQLKVRRRLIPVPASWLQCAGRLTGRSAQVARLMGNLRLDSTHIHEVLGWQPPYTVEQGLLETAQWYRGDRARSLTQSTQ